MPRGDAPRAPAEPATPPCTREDHEELKRNARAFRRGTHFVGVQGDNRGNELRNCARCGSTLTAPAKKSGKSRSGALTR